MKAYNLVGVLLTAITLMACVHTPGGTAEEHEHDESLRLTAYNNEFEVFAEAVPFVAGQQSDILAHFTLLENFKPLKEGKITVSLIVGTDGIRQSVEEPVRDGIFLFSLKPSTVGTGKLIFDINTSNGHSQLIIPTVKIFDNEHDAQHAASDAVVSGNGVLFTKEQSWKVDFATEEARYEPFGQIIRTIAQIQPSQSDEKVIVAKAGGIVAFQEVVLQADNLSMPDRYCSPLTVETWRTIIWVSGIMKLLLSSTGQSLITSVKKNWPKTALFLKETLWKQKQHSKMQR